MTPILHPSTENQFITNGIGILADAVYCIVTEELNGGYELEMQYPIDGIHYSEIKNRCILFVKPNVESEAQPFRIYRITKPLGGVVTVYAEHISYDLSGIPVKPFSSGSAAAAITALETGAAVASPFTFWTDKTNAGNLAVATPLSSRAALGAGDNSILAIYGGELEFDRYTVRLHGRRGTDRGVTIRYGKNLTSLEQDENISNVYTGVYPYYSDGESVTQLAELIVPAPGTYDYERILPLDLSGEFDSAPTQAQLKAAAEAYIENNNIGIPEISLAVSFAQLAQTEEYKHLALLERITLGDTVSVEFAALGVKASARCVKTVYNALLDRYDSIELGSARVSIADTIAKQQQAINSIASQPVSTAVQNAINAATALITGNKGGYVLLHSTTNDKQPDEILIMDKPTIEEAVKVWRWNNSGLGYSSTGYNGPYETAITQDGSIVADFIRAGGMNAARITAGVLTSADGRVQFDLTAGTLYVKSADNTVKLGFDANGNLTVRGTIYATAGEFSGTLKSVSGSFTNLTSTGSINFRNGAMQIGYFSGDTWIDFGGTAAISGGGGRVDIVANSEVAISECDFVVDESLHLGNRFYMYAPPSASSSANVRLVDQGSYYSLGLISSSRRYKKNIHDIREFDDVSARIDRVPAVTYSPRSGLEKDMNFYGFIAEDMEQEFPWLVEYSHDENGMMQAESVAYDRVPSILWTDAQNTHKILRQQSELIENLNQRLKRLEGE